MVELRTGRHEPLVRDPGPPGPLHRRRVAHDPRPLGLRARRERPGPHGADAVASPAPWAPAPGTLELPAIRASRGTADAREGGGRSAMRRPLRALVALAWHPDSRRSGGCEQVDVRGHAPRPAPARPAVPALGRGPRCRRPRLARSENQLQDPPLTGAIRRPVRWSPAAIVAACGAAVLLAAALMYALAQPEVLDKGSLLENADPVARVEVFERWTLYFDLEYERDRVSGDVVMSLLLAAVAAVSFLASAAGTRLGSTSRVEWFFALLSLGSAVLAIDELFALHESVGYNLDFLADVPGISHADDVLVLIGAAFALWFLWTFRGVIAGSRRAVALFGAAARAGGGGGGPPGGRGGGGGGPARAAGG